MNAINKAFEILDVFIRNENELSIKDLTILTNLKSSTAHRITSILVKRGYVTQAGRRGKYSLSMEKFMYFVGIMKKRLKIREISLPYLKELSRVADESVILSVRLGHVVFNVEIVNTDRLVNWGSVDLLTRITTDLSTHSLYDTAVGKVFLAHLSEREYEEYIKEIAFKQRTPNTLTNPEKLKEHLKKIKDDGLAIDIEEHDLGANGIAAPIKDMDNSVVATVSVIGPSTRLSSRRLVELAPVVKEYALKISCAMGYAQHLDFNSTTKKRPVRV